MQALASVASLPRELLGSPRSLLGSPRSPLGSPRSPLGSLRELLGSPRWQRVYNVGGRPQRVLWASTGTKDPNAPDVLYIEALAAPFTVNTVPEGTLKAFADHGKPGEIMSADCSECEAVLGQFVEAGIDIDALAAQLQDEGAKSFVAAWNELLDVIGSKSDTLK